MDALRGGHLVLSISAHGVGLDILGRWSTLFMFSIQSQSVVNPWNWTIVYQLSTIFKIKLIYFLLSFSYVLMMIQVAFVLPIDLFFHSSSSQLMILSLIRRHYIGIRWRNLKREGMVLNSHLYPGVPMHAPSQFIT